ncbi:hypothetical protein FIM66_01480 [Helicobacter pylori]|nr:hypothetical protein FIM66_01480 [Helicobacter pylori]
MSNTFSKKSMVKLPFRFKNKHCSIFRLKNAFYILYKNIPFNPPIDANPFFDQILIKVIFMIKSKLYQAISWRSFSFFASF